MNNTDKNHIWHPYSSVLNPSETIKVERANGVYLHLENGEKLIDGMSSWWSTIHGYNNETINNAISEQIGKMSHVMFGGLTHEPAISLTEKLLDIMDDSFEYVFYSDSGSVSVEIAMKMALQYHSGRNNSKNKFLTLKKGYHGDTFGAMSVCDPETGMHKIFSSFVSENYFISEPKIKFNEPFDKNELNELYEMLEKNHQNIAAIIVEPIVQGAGGMRMYAKEYLHALKEVSLKYDILLIFDEIATGFGRTGKLFAYEHAGVIPDIICIGKALTGGYMTLAATITSKKVALGIEENNNILMHGPTFMANPLACKVAATSIDLLISSKWQNNVQRIEKTLNKELFKCASLSNVKEVRVLGAIGVVELHKNVDLASITKAFLEQGVWVRPFMNLIYIMPPYIITNEELNTLINAIYKVVSNLED